MMKKVNLFNASKSFSENVAEFMVKTLWRAEYRLELSEAIETELASIKGLENCKGSAIMTEEQINEAISEKVSLIEAYKNAYEDVVSEWTQFKPHNAVKGAYKAYKAGQAEHGFVDMFKDFGLDVSFDTNIVTDLCEAVKGDSARGNVKQVVQDGKWAVTQRSQAEFVKIVYRRLADWMLDAGTIRVVGDVVKGGGEDVAELLIEIPSLTAVKYRKKSKKSAK